MWHLGPSNIPHVWTIVGAFAVFVLVKSCVEYNEAMIAEQCINNDIAFIDGKRFRCTPVAEAGGDGGTAGRAP